MDPELTAVATFRTRLGRLQGQARRLRRLAFEIERDGWLRPRAKALSACCDEIVGEAFGYFNEIQGSGWNQNPTPVAHFMGWVVHDLKNRTVFLSACCARLDETPRRKDIEDAEQLAGRVIFLCKGGGRLVDNLMSSTDQRSAVQAALSYLRRREQLSWERSRF